MVQSVGENDSPPFIIRSVAITNREKLVTTDKISWTYEGYSEIIKIWDNTIISFPKWRLLVKIGINI